MRQKGVFKLWTKKKMQNKNDFMKTFLIFYGKGNI